MTIWEHLSDPVLGAEVRDFCRDEVAPLADDIDRRDVHPTELVQTVAARGWNRRNAEVRGLASTPRRATREEVRS